MWIAACPVAQHTSAFVRPVETTSQTSVSHTWFFQETCSCSFHPKPSGYLGSSTSSTFQWTKPSGLFGSVATGLLDVFPLLWSHLRCKRLQQFDDHEVDWIRLQIFKVFLWMAKPGLIVDMEWLVSTTKCYQPSRKMEQPENMWGTNRYQSATQCSYSNPLVCLTPWVRMRAFNTQCLGRRHRGSGCSLAGGWTGLITDIPGNPVLNQ